MRTIFQLRLWILLGIYVLAFWAPWDFPLHLSRQRAWLVLAQQVSTTGWIAFHSAILALITLATAAATAAALLRTWAGAHISPCAVFGSSMEAKSLVTTGPYSRLRNPLYAGILLHAIALALLMTPSGAIFSLIAVIVLHVLLIAAEEAFLTAKFGERYLDYGAKVSRFLPKFTPYTFAGRGAGSWRQSSLQQLYFWAVALAFAALGGRYNADLLLQAVLVAFGASLVVQAIWPGSDKSN